VGEFSPGPGHVVGALLKTKQINSFVRWIHLLIFREYKPNLEAKQEGFAVWRGGGKSLTLDYISRDTGIILRIDRTGGVSLGIIEISIIFCAQPMHGHVFIVSGRIQCIIVTNGHVFRTTFLGCIWCATTLILGPHAAHDLPSKGSELYSRGFFIQPSLIVSVRAFIEQ
jgi:hypothetical protein